MPGKRVAAEPGAKSGPRAGGGELGPRRSGGGLVTMLSRSARGGGPATRVGCGDVEPGRSSGALAEPGIAPLAPGEGRRSGALGPGSVDMPGAGAGSTAGGAVSGEACGGGRGGPLVLDARAGGDDGRAEPAPTIVLLGIGGTVGARR
jgi:hypothetical protein